MRLADRVYVFLGAEGQAELPEGCDWLREVDEEEARAVQREADPWPLARGDVRFNLDELTIDRTGRPYWLVEVTLAAPGPVRARAADLVRTVRL